MHHHIVYSGPLRRHKHPLTMTFQTPFNLRVILISLVLIVMGLATTVHTKDLMHHRLRQHNHKKHERRGEATAMAAAEDLLQTQAKSSKRLQFSNVSKGYEDFETSAATWTGAKISTAISSSAEHLKQDQHHHRQHHQQQLLSSSLSTAYHAINHAPSYTTTRHKTKSGLLIESNVELDTEQEAEVHQAASVAAPYTEMDLPQTSSASSLSKPSKQERKRNRQNHQHQRKRNGRHHNHNNGGGGGADGSGGNGAAGSSVGSNNGQRQKLQRNALRLLNRDSDSHMQGVKAGGGLFPQLFNVATRASITVNATCGQSGREEYCKLVDAYPHKKWATQCGICNAHSSDVAKHRPIESVISHTNMHDQWWQSPTLQYGRNFEYVTITMDLKQA
uniref:Laminin N-terminal domain-containing protein n=1 Tax=Stomoxys calcitrans TaxID=35570 RepID=A0A1I8QD10_STOCA